MNRPKVTCTACRGTGLRDMGAEYFETLHVFTKSKRPMTTVEVAEQLHWNGGISAINNRLADLERMGFLNRKKCGVGRTWVYSFSGKAIQ